MKKLKSINPANEVILGEVMTSPPGEIIEKVNNAHHAKHNSMWVYTTTRRTRR